MSLWHIFKDYKSIFLFKKLIGIFISLTLISVFWAPSGQMSRWKDPDPYKE